MRFGRGPIGFEKRQTWDLRRMSCPLILEGPSIEIHGRFGLVHHLPLKDVGWFGLLWRSPLLIWQCNSNKKVLHPGSDGLVGLQMALLRQQNENLSNGKVKPAGWL